MTRKRILKGSLVITMARVVAYALSFVRNLLLARLLSKNDFGIATLLATVVTVLEIAGKMSLGQQIVQSKDGDSPHFLSSIHFFQFCFSILGTLLFLILSPLLARIFGGIHFTIPLALLSFCILCKAFESLDCFRLQREFDFLPSSLYEVVPHVIITACAYPVILFFGDYRAAIALTILRSFVALVISHWVSRRSYRISADRQQIGRIWSFGWPLMIANLLLFCSQQADQLVVGTLVSPAALAVYCILSVVCFRPIGWSSLSSSLRAQSGQPCSV
jgi:O-antigen/teichoic acid export membrane protein